MSRRANIKPVLDALQRLYPKQLADSKWDNTGLLVDSIAGRAEARPARVLLTIDLTASVCDEALAHNSDLIVAYHPFIFGGIKALASSNPQHVSLMRLVAAGVAVYSPHTAVDAAVGGNADWLADAVTDAGNNQRSRATLQPVTPAVAGHENAGYGRVVELARPVSLADMVAAVKRQLGLATVQLVEAPAHRSEPIRSVAMCAGSGGSVLRGAEADLWLTGELGHHEMLFLKESGVSAIVCGHSNTERGFLAVLRDRLLTDLRAAGAEADVRIAETDRDPIQYV